MPFLPLVNTTMVIEIEFSAFISESGCNNFCLAYPKHCQQDACRLSLVSIRIVVKAQSKVSFFSSHIMLSVVKVILVDLEIWLDNIVYIIHTIESPQNLHWCTMYNGGYQILMKYLTRSNGLELSNPTAAAKGQTILPRNLQYSSLGNSALKYLGNGNFEAITSYQTTSLMKKECPPSHSRSLIFISSCFSCTALSAMTSQTNWRNRRRSDQTTKARSFLSGSLVFFPNHKLKVRSEYHIL